MPRLTVIVTFHNLRTLVPQTLTTLRRNADPDIEFILLDDASSDDTAGELERSSATVPGARFVPGERPVGVSALRNRGIALARGTYLTFLDGDDFVADGYYRSLLEHMERLGVDFLRTDHVRVNGRERTIARIAHGPRGVPDNPRHGILPADRTTSVDTPQPWTSIYHRRLHDDRAILEFREDLRTCEDRVHMWRLHLRAESFAVVGLTGMHWRRGRIGSLTQITDDRQLDFIPAFMSIIKMVQDDPDGERFLPKALRTFLAMACFHLSKDEGSYPKDVQKALVQRTTAALAQLPQGPLSAATAQLDPPRRRMIARLGGGR